MAIIGTYDTRTGQITMASASNGNAVGMSPPYWRINRLAWDEPRIAGFILPGRVTLALCERVQAAGGRVSALDGSVPLRPERQRGL